jgi:diguanylate cyclase (GGDEF)-like protein
MHTNYGDPQKILSQVHKCVREMNQFGPEVIAVYNCFGRKSFWGDLESASHETRMLAARAPVYGYCTSGELVRMNSPILLHNMTMIIAGMREGGPIIREIEEESEPAQEDSAMSLISRLVNYINTATAEILEANRCLSIMASTDRLTGLLNRGEIQKRIRERMEQHPCENTHLIMLDLDDFKGINDVFGHQAGDEVLQKVAYTIRDVLREGDVAGRYGGDEFIAILPNADHEQMKAISERLTEAVESNTQLAMYGVTLSIGASSWHVAGSGYSFHKQFKLTDDALYEAKRNGRHQTRLIQIT